MHRAPASTGFGNDSWYATLPLILKKPIPKFKPMTNPLHGWHLPLHQGPTSLKFNASRNKMELHPLFNNAWINFASPFPYFKWSRKSSLSSWHSISIHHFIFFFAITKKNKSNRASTTVMYPLNFVILFFFFLFFSFFFLE